MNKIKRKKENLEHTGKNKRQHVIRKKRGGIN